VIFGSGPFAEVAAYLFRHDGGREPVAYTVHADYVREPELRCLPVLPFERLEERWPPAEADLFVAVGARGVNRFRASVCAEASGRGYALATYVSPRATTFPDLTVGANTFVFEDNTVQPYVTIGDDVVLWSGNHIGHHSRIGDHCFITSHVVVSGNVTIGSHCYVGVNATIRDGISIGDATVIGAGALVMRSTGEGEVYLGQRSEPDPRRSDELSL
jgi:sugar O-acyltransferase (sialic acid O-acetyltransferase NeuD family)